MSGLDRARLVRLLGMLGSRYDGEVVTAGRMAHQLVCAAGLTWPQLLNPPIRDLPAERRDPAFQIAECPASAEVLTDWVFNFVHGLRGLRRISERQREILEGILAKVRRAQRQREAA